jgi:uncharacterized protein YceK
LLFELANNAPDLDELPETGAVLNFALRPRLLRLNSIARIVSCVAVCGCATVLDLTAGRQDLFGGAQIDCGAILACASVIADGAFKQTKCQVAPAILVMAALDFPLSVVGDFVVLPVTSYYAIQQWREGLPAPRPKHLPNASEQPVEPSAKPDS